MVTMQYVDGWKLRKARLALQPSFQKWGSEAESLNHKTKD